MTLTPVVKNHHVEEAIRLFEYSTMDAVSAGSADGLSRGELNEEMSRIERELKRRLPIGWSTSYQSLVKEFVTQQGYSSHALERTLYILEKREILRFSNQVCCICCRSDAAADIAAEKGCASRGCVIGRHSRIVAADRMGILHNCAAAIWSAATWNNLLSSQQPPSLSPQQY